VKTPESLLIPCEDGPTETDGPNGFRLLRTGSCALAPWRHRRAPNFFLGPCGSVVGVLGGTRVIRIRHDGQKRGHNFF